MHRTLARYQTVKRSKPVTDPTVTTRTLRVRVKDRHAAFLLDQAFHVNQVWNFVNERSHEAWTRKREWLSAPSMQKLTDGATKEGLPLHSDTVIAIVQEHAKARTQFKRTKLRWRKSSGSKRSLGWIPVKPRCITYRNGQIHYRGVALKVWDSYDLSKHDLGTGSFSEDARGRWYLNVTVKVKKKPLPTSSEVKRSVGIDPGVRSLATSDGKVFDLAQIFRAYEATIASAQRANKKDRVRALHAKVANLRKDQHHKLSTALVRDHGYGAIFIGNASAPKLAKTRMAKSVLDASWGAFRTMLQYKCDDAGVWFDEVNEAFSTQTCSCCHQRSGPRGLSGLRIREWACEECGAYHHRDINAAINILAVGHHRLAEGIPSL